MQQNSNRTWLRGLKEQVVKGYGGKCQCPGCNEWRFEFLTVDHPDDNGAEQRRKLGSKEIGASLYQRLIREQYPSEYQLLCFNCNCAKGFYGQCPHVKEEVENGK
jgi:hypothetical protein